MIVNKCVGTTGKSVVFAMSIIKISKKYNVLFIKIANLEN